MPTLFEQLPSLAQLAEDLVDDQEAGELIPEAVWVTPREHAALLADGFVCYGREMVLDLAELQAAGVHVHVTD
jgi:hypothetical protein